MTRLPDAATNDTLRELVRHRDRLVADFGDRVRQLHRLVDYEVGSLLTSIVTAAFLKSAFPG